MQLSAAVNLQDMALMHITLPRVWWDPAQAVLLSIPPCPLITLYMVLILS